MPRVLEILSNILHPIEYSYGSTEVSTIYPTFSIAYLIYSTSHKSYVEVFANRKVTWRSRPRNVTEAQDNYNGYSRYSSEQWAVATINIAPGWYWLSSGIDYTGIIKLRHSWLKMCMWICEILVCLGANLIVRALLAKTLELRRHRKAVRILWSRFELDPSTVARAVGSQSFSAGSG